LIASALLPPFGGGVTRVAWETAKHLANDYEVHFLAFGTGETSTREGVTIHSVRFKHPATLWYSTLLRPRIIRLMREISPHIVHSHVLHWAYVFAGAKSRKVVTCHGLDWLGLDLRAGLNYPRPLTLRRLFLKEAISNADLVCAPSKWMADLVQESYGVNCKTLPNGVDTNTFAQIEVAKRPCNIVLYVGRLELSKGLMDLFETAKALPQYEFWLIGDSGGTLRNLSLPNVKLLGRVNNQKLLAVYYNLATVCIFPSHWEIFSLVGLEAMACGKAIIATKLGFTEYVENGHDGLIIEAKQPQELVRSIKYIMDNKEARTRIEGNAREKALKFDWDKVMKFYKAVYESLS